MIEPPPKVPSLQAAAEWVVRALREEGLPILLAGRAALDYQREYTGSVDIDVLIGTDFPGALSVLDAYADRGDLVPIPPVPGEVHRYLVSGYRPVDVIDPRAAHPDLFDLLRKKASKRIRFGSAEYVDVVTREGYFVLAIMIGLRGFARRKREPMMKVREAWSLFGERTDAAEVDRLLEELGAKTTLEKIVRPSAARRSGERWTPPR